MHFGGVFNKNKMAKKVKEEEKSIVVLGIEISDNHIYEIVPKKPSQNAPDLYKELGSEKMLDPNVSNWVSLYTKDGYWNTGFFPESHIYQKLGISKEQAEVESQKAIAFILQPMERLNRRIMDLVNPEVSRADEKDKFDNVMVNLSVGRQFNTSKPQDRFELYIAILGGHLAPVGFRNNVEKESGLLDENNPVYATSQYAVEIKDKVRSVKEKRSKQVFTAYGKVYSLLETNKKAIVSILNYEGVGVSIDMTDEAITSRSQVFFESEENIENFLDTVEKYEKDNVFKDELLVMDSIRNNRGLKVLQKEGREYYLLGKSLGTTDRQVANRIAKDDVLYEEFLKLTATK